MSNLLKSLLSKAKKPDMDHGIHDNCIITKVEAGGRKKKDGDSLNMNCFTTFGKLNDKGEVVSEKEVSWFNLDVTNEHIRENFSEQMLQLVNIMECFFEKGDIDELFNPIFETAGIDGEESLQNILADKASLKKLTEEIFANYAASMETALNDKENLLRVKLCYDSKGKNIQVPKFGRFVELMSLDKKDSELKFSKFEEENETKSRNLVSTTTKPTNI